MQRDFFSKYGHKCTLPKDNENDFHEHIDTKNPILNFIRKSVLISTYNAVTSLHFNSQESIAKERRRQIEHYTYVMHPYSSFRRYWEMVTALILLYLVIIIPLQWVLGDMTVYIAWGNFAFLLHIIINFNTGYYSGGPGPIIELDRKVILRHYFQNHLCIDFFSTVPILIHYFIIRAILLNSVNETDHKIYSTSHYISHALVILKILRLKSLTVYIRRSLDFYNFTDNSVDIILLMLYGFAILHIASCTQLITGIIHVELFNYHDYVVQWFNPNDVKQYEDAIKYCICLYRALNSMSGIGMGVFNPTSTADRAFIGFMVIIGRIYITIMFGKILLIIQTMSSNNSKYSLMRYQLENYAHHMRLSKRLTEKLFNEFDYQRNISYFHEDEILPDLSSQLKEDILMLKSNTVMKNIPFFKTIPAHVAIRIFSCLKYEFIEKRDKLFQTEDTGDAETLYFVVSGTLAHYSPSGLEIFHVCDGDYTGEMCALANNRQRILTCLAVESTELRLMKRNDFQKIIQYYPDLETEISKRAIDRLDNLLFAEEKLSRRLEALQNKKGKIRLKQFNYNSAISTSTVEMNPIDSNNVEV